MRRQRRIHLAPVSILAGALAASSAPAADLYFSGDLVMSGVNADASGSTTFFSISGSDEDSSPGYGGALGLGFALPEVLPSVGSLETPEVTLRFEVEGVLGRDWELRTDGGTGFFTDANAWSVMTNAWLDVPVQKPLSYFFGRMPILDPLSIYGGGGIGLAGVEVDTTDNVSEGSTSENRFAWQAGAGVSYEFSEWATLSTGWRYLSLGEVETDLRFIGGGGALGSHDLDLSAHEIVSTLRFDFHSRPIQEMSPRRWSLPRPSLPRWKWPWRRSQGP